MNMLLNTLRFTPFAPQFLTRGKYFLKTKILVFFLMDSKPVVY